MKTNTILTALAACGLLATTPLNAALDAALNTAKTDTAEKPTATAEVAAKTTTVFIVKFKGKG